MSDSSSNLNLPYILPAQAQKHVTHNEAIEILDALVQLYVQDFDAVTPPISVEDGQTYAIGNLPTGDWSGKANSIAVYLNGGWEYLTPKEGWIAAGPSAELRQFVDGQWVDLRGAAPISNIPSVGIGASSDTYNVLTVAGSASLFTHSGSGHQMKLNKAAISDAVSLLYQSNWSGRAELGLVANDDFVVKVSADGANWITAIEVEGTSGAVQLADALTLAPSVEPTGAPGRIYFDSTSHKLRCFDGTQWNDMF